MTNKLTTIIELNPKLNNKVKLTKHSLLKNIKISFSLNSNVSLINLLAHPNHSFLLFFKSTFGHINHNLFSSANWFLPFRPPPLISPKMPNYFNFLIGFYVGNWLPQIALAKLLPHPVVNGLNPERNLPVTWQCIKLIKFNLQIQKNLFICGSGPQHQNNVESGQADDGHCQKGAKWH